METKIGKKWKKLQLQYESIKPFILHIQYIPTLTAEGSSQKIILKLAAGAENIIQKCHLDLSVFT